MPANVNAQPDSQETSPVVLELFTAEGCSSCPPADSLLLALQEKSRLPGAEIIAFEEHVDYWNEGGWRDPFSSPQWTQRQSDYQTTFGRRYDAIYTPQLVIDGTQEVVGNKNSQVISLVTAAARQPKLGVRIVPGDVQKSSQAFSVSVSNAADGSNGDSADVMLAVTETGRESNVTAGENSGKQLKHAAILRHLEKIGTIHAKNGPFSATPTAKFESSWKKENLRVVVFVQDKKSHHILGAAEVKLAPATAQSEEIRPNLSVRCGGTVHFKPNGPAALEAFPVVRTFAKFRSDGLALG